MWLDFGLCVLVVVIVDLVVICDGVIYFVEWLWGVVQLLVFDGGYSWVG